MLQVQQRDEQTLISAGRAARRAVARLAREDPAIFNEFVLRDERDGSRIKQAPMHDRWQRYITKYSRLIIWSHVDGGKTNQVAIGRVLWELGRNPNLRVVIISKTNDLAMKIVRAIGQYIERSPELREVFPNLRPNRDPGLPWTSHKLTVEREVRAKDPSVQACGAIAGNIIGARIDLLILDDVIDQSNTRTQTPRETMWTWVRSTLFGRLTADARVVAVGNAWHPEDLLHRLEKEPRFIGFRFPVISDSDKLTWPSHWTRERIQDARDDMGPLEFARALLCQARDDETAVIKREWIQQCMDRGDGIPIVHSREELYAELGLNTTDVLAADAAWRMGDLDACPGGIRFYTGVDLAVSKKDAADKTVFFTIAVFPDGTRRVLEIIAGRFNAPEILEMVKDVYRRFGSTFIVENNAAQDYIVQMVKAKTSIPIIGFTTGRQKLSSEYGISRLGVEFFNSKWIIPTFNGKASREIDAWVQELYHYDPTAHTGDRLMASWFAQYAAVHYEQSNTGGVGVTVLGPDDDN